MSHHIGLAAVISVGLFTGALRAKPPEVPAVPRADCEVPPPLVQDFFLSDRIGIKPEALSVPPGFEAIRRNLPVCILLSGGAADALTKAADTMAFQPGTPLENLEKLNDAARDFELAEALREGGLTEAAAEGYERVLKLVPGSRYAQMAAERLGRSTANPPADEPK
jgi:hypothetical protein